MAPVLRLAPSIRATSNAIRTSSFASPITTTTLPPTGAAFTKVAANTRYLSVTRVRRSDDSHGSHYDQPGGWLWGVPPGQKAEKEGWEGVWTYGFYGSIALCVIAYAFKPDSSIETWALEEAKRRLQAEGTLPEDK